MGSKMSVAAPSSASAGAARGTESAATRDQAAGATASKGFSSAMNAAAQPSATSHQATRAAPAQRDSSSNNTNSKATPAPASKPGVAAAGSSDDASNGAASVVASDASAIDGGAVSPQGATSDKSTGKTRSTAAFANPAANAPATLALLLAAAGMQPTAPGSSSAADSAPDPSDAADDASTAAQSIAAMVATAGFATTAAPALAGQASTASTASTAIVGSAASASAGVTSSGSDAGDSGRTAADASAIKFDSLMTGAAAGDAAGDATTLLQTKSDASGSDPTIGSNGMPDMMRGLVSAASQAAGAPRTIAIPVSDRNWSGAVAAQVQWQVNSNVQSATLQLSPEHLGPLEVRIDVQSSQVNVSFSANHADTRAALEQSVPRLREILANGGLTLGQASVQQEARSGSQFAPPVSRVAGSESQNADPISISSTRAIGLLDEYA
jgi:flagellar hook-length control protein FliK